jgi:hypothetical protein
VSGPTELAFVGDLILGVADVDVYFDSVRPILQSVDVAVAHVEWPHTDRGQVSSADIPAPAAPPGNLAAVARAGFSVATLAANHVFDQGTFGVRDTVDGLRAAGVEPTGAGSDLAEARAPAIVERDGRRYGFLSYNAVGPRESWATGNKAGGAYVRIHSHYDLEMASPGSAPTEYTSLDVETLDAMVADITALRAEVDVVSVSLHKGMVFERATLAQYERPLARAAIDAGADIVLGHHAHVPRGVEVYKGKPIFHGLNHFVVAYPPHGDPTSDAGRARTRPTRSPIMKLIEPDRTVRDFPFGREARYTMIARVVVDDAGIVSAGITPCWIDDGSVTIAQSDETTGAEVAQHIADVGREAGLSVPWRWAGDRVLFYERSDAAAR